MSEEMPKEPGSEHGSSEHIRAQAVSALFCNRTFISVFPDVTRIAFSEAAYSVDSVYRVAIVMPTAQAIDMAQLILSLAAEGEKARQEAAESDLPLQT